ncbi:MAG TPA: hypothetical protein VIJ00_12000, partial [Nakamurella sp.]
HLKLGVLEPGISCARPDRTVDRRNSQRFVDVGRDVDRGRRVCTLVAVTLQIDSVRGARVIVVGVQSVVSVTEPCPRVNATGRCRSWVPLTWSSVICPT